MGSRLTANEPTGGGGEADDITKNCHGVSHLRASATINIQYVLVRKARVLYYFVQSVLQSTSSFEGNLASRGYLLK